MAAVKLSRRIALVCLPVAVVSAIAAARQSGQSAPASRVAPRATVEDGCTAFAYAPDGRLAFSTRHILQGRKLETQRDDIWIYYTDGSKKKIFAGERYSRFGPAFSYTVTSLRWSPDGKRIAAQVHTSQLFGDRGGVQPGEMLLLIDDEGREIKLPGAEGGIDGAVDGAWLADAETVAFVAPASRVNPLLTLRILRRGAVRPAAVFAGHTFADIAWHPKSNSAAVVERQNAVGSAARLAFLDLVAEDGRALATLPRYQGGLSLSPAANLVAYFIDEETLEIRGVATPQNSARIHVAYGQIGWSPDESRIFVRRGIERHDGDLVAYQVPQFIGDSSDPAETQPELLLGDLLIWRFRISPDGRSVAVSQPGDRKLLLFNLPE
ncbi:MAG TPA: hypothetical protein VFO34_00035 [Candidatus Acidoferrales bacterium]|nr:hypothetical protein [Candidatus Acidoferrales bacterium]